MQIANTPARTHALTHANPHASIPTGKHTPLHASIHSCTQACALGGAATPSLTGCPQVRAHRLVRRVRGVRAHRHDRRVPDHRHGSRSRQLLARRQDRRHERTGAASEFVEFELTDLAGGARAPRLGRRASVFTRTGRAFAASKWKHSGTADVVEHTGMAVHPSSCVHRQDHRCLAIGLAVQSHDSRKRQLDLWSQVP